MRGTDGIELQRRMMEIDPELIVIIMTGYASVDTAVTALKQGAYDYITKPLDPDDVTHLIQNALSHRRSKEENVRMKEVIEHHVVHPAEIIGQSTAIRKVFDAIETVGPTDATVLITGESGTGKELVARAIHAASPRRYHPMVAIHCGALTETLLESELFGHEKGAFTGAQYRKKGKFEVADGRDALDPWRGLFLAVPADELRPPQGDEVYLHELEGFSVRLPDDTPLGLVTAVYEMPSGIMIEVQGPKREFMLPYKKEFVQRVDREGRRLVVAPPEGLIDE